tara:strand:- start:434 stop:2056 length:1623 start_codon:yes stop_codon:yes gene_type:complete
VHKFLEFFPYDAARESQVDAIKFAIDSCINDNKKFIIIEAGTGVGKSAIGLTLGRYLNSISKDSDSCFSAGTYFLTTQKILQDQYVSDFGKKRGCVKSIKSSSNYMCTYHKKNTCQASQQLLRTADKDSKFFKTCTFNCNYKNEKSKFLESEESVTNFPYFLAEATYSGKIVPRELLVVDEAHNVESELSKFIEVIISERFCKQSLKLDWPGKCTQAKVVKWIKEVYYNKAKSQLDHVEKMLKKTGLKSRLSEFSKLSNQYDILKSHVNKIDMFLRIYNRDNWVMEAVPSFGRSQRKFSFRPIDVSYYASNYLFRLGKTVLLMSATILDKETFCKSLGIDESEASFISIPTPFPKENRPILFVPAGSMASKSIGGTLPRLRNSVNEILNFHKNEKGIIHCHTYRIAKYLKDNIKSDRLMLHDATNRDETLKKHASSKKPVVLLSPSMAEGVDLKDDLSRFQVICKIPYPYLGDPLVKKRMNKWKKWYPMQTAKLIVQSAGRSIRSDSDSAVTYILDADWKRFYYSNKGLFPKTFTDSLKG